MTQAGWVLDVDPLPWAHGHSKYCDLSTFWGYKKLKPVGTVSTVFKSSGSATLNFGNCYSSGVTNAYLNRKLISSAGANQEFKVVDFAYKQEDELKLEEVNTGIIKINALQLTCKGKLYIS